MSEWKTRALNKVLPTHFDMDGEASEYVPSEESSDGKLAPAQVFTIELLKVLHKSVASIPDEVLALLTEAAAARNINEIVKVANVKITTATVKEGNEELYGLVVVQPDESYLIVLNKARHPHDLAYASANLVAFIFSEGEALKRDGFISARSGKIPEGNFSVKNTLREGPIVGGSERKILKATIGIGELFWSMMDEGNATDYMTSTEKALFNSYREQEEPAEFLERMNFTIATTNTFDEVGDDAAMGLLRVVDGKPEIILREDLWEGAKKLTLYTLACERFIERKLLDEDNKFIFRLDGNLHLISSGSAKDEICKPTVLH